MTNINREQRYVVMKFSDVKGALDTQELAQLNFLAQKVNEFRFKRGKGFLTSVVVESDWPEYEPTWNAITERSLRELKGSK